MLSFQNLLRVGLGLDWNLFKDTKCAHFKMLFLQYKYTHTYIYILFVYNLIFICIHTLYIYVTVYTQENIYTYM